MILYLTTFSANPSPLFTAPHHCSPLLTTFHHSSPFLTTPHHFSPLLTTLHHSSPLLTHPSLPLTTSKNSSLIPHSFTHSGHFSHFSTDSTQPASTMVLPSYTHTPLNALHATHFERSYQGYQESDFPLTSDPESHASEELHGPSQG